LTASVFCFLLSSPYVSDQYVSRHLVRLLEQTGQSRTDSADRFAPV